MRILTFAAIMLIMSMMSYAADYSFEIPLVESKKEILELSGNLDVKYSILRSRKDSQLYKLQYNNRSLSDVLASYRFEYYLDGDYQTKNIGIHLKTRTEYYSDSQTNADLHELYGNISLSNNSFLLIGKRMYSWGKGYAFNPVGYVNPRKDPENPELSKSGILSINYEYSKSFQSELIKNSAFNIIVITPENTVNNKISELKNTDIAGKLYLLFWDTDIDFMHYYSSINPSKSGFDFSRNILTSLEIHGELSQFSGQPRYSISNNALKTENINDSSYLLGIRWLNEWNITTIMEYYHNDAGLKPKEFEEYNAFLVNSVVSGDSNSIASAINMNSSYFSGSNLMQDYMYLKISLPEPFNWVYFTPSVYAILNINDESSTVGIPLSYKPVTNFEFIFWPTFLIGGNNTEYGSKQYENKLDLWLRFYF